MQGKYKPDFKILLLSLLSKKQRKTTGLLFKKQVKKSWVYKQISESLTFCYTVLLVLSI